MWVGGKQVWLVRELLLWSKWKRSWWMKDIWMRYVGTDTILANFQIFLAKKLFHSLRRWRFLDLLECFSILWQSFELWQQKYFNFCDMNLRIFIVKWVMTTFCVLATISRLANPADEWKRLRLCHTKISFNIQRTFNFIFLGTKKLFKAFVRWPLNCLEKRAWTDLNSSKSKF